MPGKLQLVGTPLGNLSDLAPRGHEALAQAKLVACEDTRRTGRLFQLLGLPKPHLISLHQHNEASRIPDLIQALRDGSTVVLVSDSGLPCLSDPGARLVAAAHEAELPVEVIGGPTALANAAAGSGLVGVASPGFIFAGFPPRTAKARAAFWQAYAAPGLPLVCYESPNRVAALCASALAVLGNRPARLARELTKLHESWHGPDLASLARMPAPLKGECVLVIGAGEALPVAAAPLAAGSSLKELAAAVAAQTGISPQQAYKALVQLKASAR